RKVLGDEMGATLFTIAKDVKIQVEFNPAVVSQYRLVGYENRVLREEDFDNDAVDAGDIGAGHQVTAMYEVIPAGSDGWVPARRYEDTVDTRARELASEAAYVKLRYKRPGGDTSQLLTYTLPASALDTSRAPAGDFAFAAAVAAFGQKLRGDTLLANMSYPRIAALAGTQTSFWRQEFIELVKTAEGLE
ncbi:MAG: YfbK domain-containing protein, partial [Sphingomonadales bacterium]